MVEFFYHLKFSGNLKSAYLLRFVIVGQLKYYIFPQKKSIRNTDTACSVPLLLAGTRTCIVPISEVVGKSKIFVKIRNDAVF